jgi:hypothetical protein
VLLALGILSVLQAVFLPGYLVVRWQGLHRGGAARALVLSFATSLLVNHLLAFVLTSAHAYRPGTLYALVALELVALIWLARRDRSTGDPEDRDLVRWRCLIPALAARRPPVALAGSASILALLAVFAWYVCRGALASGAVFSAWDPVVSWNRWAIDWAENRLPWHTWHYPQLLPTTISLTYVMLGGEQVQFFARAIIALFPLAILLACWDLTLRRQDARYAAAGALGGVLLALTLRAHLLAGLAEEPVAAMNWMCLYVLLLGERAASWAEAKRFLFFGVVFAAGGALTKQAGWHMAAIYPVLAYLLVIRRHAPAGSLIRVRAVAGCMVGIVALAGPWYIYRELNPSDSEFGFIFGGVHAGRNYAERAQRALALLSAMLAMPSWVFLYVSPALLALSLLDRSWRWITVLFTAPFILVWVFFFTYDIRNLVAGIFPAAAGMVIGVGGAWEAVRVRGLTRRPGVATMRARGAVWLAMVALVGLLLALSRGPLRDSKLLEQQRRQQAEIYSPEVNRAVLEGAPDAGPDAKVVTNYQILPYLPGLKGAYVAHALQAHSADSLEKALSDRAVRYVLYYGGPPHPSYLKDGLPTARFSTVRAGTCPNGASYMLLSVQRP